jgi:DNA mismatch repair ATPase MutS
MKINLENEDLDFSYKVYPGKSLRSYGIELIKRLKFPEEVINTANNNIHKFETQEIN